jgi:hypothetical protein
VDFDGAKTLAAAESLSPDKLPDERFLTTHCSHMIEAIDLICNWTKNI